MPTIRPPVQALIWDELISAGAFRVYRGPADLHRSLDELGIA